MADYVESELKKVGITISKPVLAMICIFSGILVIIFPSLLVWIVGFFLILQGALLFTDLLESGRLRPTAEPVGVYCSDCGTRNIKEAVYCKNCGSRLKPSEPTRPQRRPRKRAPAQTAAVTS